MELVRPPLNDPPKLESIVVDKNDKTGESGYWMNRADTEAVAGYFSHVRNVKDNWR